MENSELDDFKKLVEEIPVSCSRWVNYLNCLLMHKTPDYEEQLSRALVQTKFEVANSEKIWNIYYGHFSSKLDLNDHNAIVRLKQLWLNRIQVPHNSLANTINSFSSFISTYFNDNYIDEMKHAKSIQKNAKLIIERLEPWEFQVSQKRLDPLFWIEYMTFINKSRAKVLSFSLKSSLVKTVFYRSLECLINAVDDLSSHEEIRLLKESWIQVWEFYISLEIEFNSEIFHQKFAKFYYGNAHVWISYLESANTIEKLEEIRSIPIDTFKESKDFIQFYSTLLSKEFGLLEENADTVLEWIINDIEQVYPLAVQFNDVFHTLEKLCIEIYESIGSVDEAKALLVNLLKDNNSQKQVEVWLFAVEFEKRNGDHASLNSLFGSSNEILFQLDWPERLLEEWKRFLLFSGSPEEWKYFKELSNKFNDSEGDISREGDIDTPEIVEESHYTSKRAREESEESVQVSKRPKLKGNNKPVLTRDREHLSVLVSNLPEGITENDIAKYFGDCGIIRSIVQDSNDAIIEMSSSSEVFAALTKDYKIFKSTEIRVKKLENNIVWATNFPPEYNMNNLKELFISCGKVMNVRLPSLRNNTDRRFCYVEFISSEDANLAVLQLNDKEINSSINGKSYKLVVKISDTEQKDKRSGAVEEGRQVYVSRLDFHFASEEVLRKLFSKYGEIESIKLPLSRKNMKMNRNNDGYAFISYKNKESALNAIKELNGTVLFSREMVVTLSETRTKHTTRMETKDPYKKPYIARDEINSKTLSLFNLDDTVNISQLMVLMKEVGPVLKIELRSDLNAALVEFQNVSDCGRAEIKFDRFKIGNKTLEVGSRNKFISLLRNKRSVQPPKEQNSEEPVEKRALSPVTVPKSNDDFRKMFLGL